MVLVPVYSMDGKLIKPSEYHCYLEETLVELYFALNHWSIARKNGNPGNDVYSADIVMIQYMFWLYPSQLWLAIQESRGQLIFLLILTHLQQRNCAEHNFIDPISHVTSHIWFLLHFSLVPPLSFCGSFPSLI